MHVSDVTGRVLTQLRDAGDYPDNPFLNAADLVPFFPEGCPEAAPTDWPLDTVDYDGPHASTICPGCVESWRAEHLVSQPRTVPAGTPLSLHFPWAAPQPASATPEGASRPADTDPQPVDASV